MYAARMQVPPWNHDNHSPAKAQAQNQASGQYLPKQIGSRGENSFGGPGGPSQDVGRNGAFTPQKYLMTNNLPPTVGTSPQPPQPPVMQPPSQSLLTCAAFNANGHVNNLPQSMLKDQYGLAGFFVGQKYKHTSSEPLPDVISDEVIKDMDFHNNSSCLQKPTEPKVLSEPPEKIIPEYMIAQRLLEEKDKEVKEWNTHLMRQLLGMQVNQFSDDLLFYLFYVFAQDGLQLIAASHLYNKGWRYHMKGQVWIHPIPGTTYELYQQKQDWDDQEKGLYQLFDYKVWKIVTKELCVKYNEFEGPPGTLDPNLLVSYNLL